MISRGRVLAAVSLALALTPTSAAAYCRTTTVPVPPDYKPQVCFAQGLPLFWKNACVGYDVSLAASQRFSLDIISPVVDEAFAAFTSATCTGGKVGITATNLGPVDCADVRYNQKGTNSNLIVFRDDGWPHSDPNNTLALTTVTFNADTGEIYDADMEVNSSDKNLTVGDPVPGDGFDMLSVLTHEAGHFLGMAHATDNKAAMYASYKPGAVEMRSLKPDDVEGICAIYPSATRRSVDPSVAATGFVEAAACDPTPRRGLAKDCGSTEAPQTEKSGCSVPPTRDDGARATGLAACVAAMVVAASARRRRAG
jgi:hypothetical protein